MADRIGHQVGNYSLQALLGAGGYANVYLGEHRYLKTQAAIKMLSQRLHPHAQQAFLEEAQTIARLIHPHIVRVLDFGIDQGTPFLVMDYAPYGSLRQRYPIGTRLPLPDLLPLVQQAAQAIQYAHAANRIHRDIKPENLLVGPRQEVWLSDFGLAVLAESDHASSRAIAGTLAYVAPEQLQGKPVPASDQYALGVVVYEWLSGAVPFAGTVLGVVGQHLLTAPPPLHNKLPDLPPAVEEVVLTALAKHPRKRFQSVEAFATALARASEGAWPTAPVSARTDLVPQLLAHTPDQAERVLPLPLDAGGIPAATVHPLSTEPDEAGTAPPTHPPAAPLTDGAAAPTPGSQKPSGNAPRARGSGLVAFWPPALRATPRHKTTERLAVLLLLLTVLGVGFGFLGLGWLHPLQPANVGRTAPTPLPTAWATVTVAATPAPTTLPSATPTARVTPTAHPAPTPTPVPHQFGVAPISFGDHCSSSQTKLPQKTLLLDNTLGTLPVTWQGMVSQKDPSNEWWAAVNPNNGMVPAGQKVTIILKPADHICMNATSSTTYYASIVYQEDQRSKVITITDLVQGY